MLALGLVETRGLIGAIEAADAMLKAADVRLLEKSLASGGLVTITIAGEVAAVQSSVDAAAASIARIEGAECVSRHVIPRPDAELEHILLLQPRSIEIEAAAPAEAAQEGQTSMTDPADKAKRAPEQGKARGHEHKQTSAVGQRPSGSAHARADCLLRQENADRRHLPGGSEGKGVKNGR